MASDFFVLPLERYNLNFVGNATMICLIFTAIAGSYESALVGSEISIMTLADYAREINKVFSEVSAGR